MLKNIGGQVATENSLLEKSYSESQQQTTELKNIGTDIGSQKAILQNIGEDVARAIYEGLDERMNDAIEKFCEKLEEKILPQTDRICAAIDELGKAIDKLGAGGTDKLGEVISNGVGAQMERFSSALDRFSDNIDAKLKAAEEISKIMNEQLLATLEKLNKALEQNRIAQDEQNRTNIDRNREVSENFESLVTKLIADLKEFTERQQEFLDKVANTNAAQISAAVKAFNEIVNRHNETTQKTFAQVQSQLNETNKFLQQVNNAGISLRQAAEPVKQSTLLLNKNLSETSAQMNTLATANQTTRQNLSMLSDKLKGFADNFDGIANELERSTNIIKDSLENYNAKTGKELQDKLKVFDKSMGDAVSHLQSLVEDLSDALDDFNRKRR